MYAKPDVMVIFGRDASPRRPRTARRAIPTCCIPETEAKELLQVSVKGAVKHGLKERVQAGAAMTRRSLAVKATLQS